MTTSERKQAESIVRPRYLLGAILQASCHPEEGYGGAAGVARKLGISRSYLHDIIVGKSEPGTDVLASIADFMGMPMDEVYAWQRALNGPS